MEGNRISLQDNECMVLAVFLPHIGLIKTKFFDYFYVRFSLLLFIIVST